MEDGTIQEDLPRVITDSKEMYETIIDRNIRHFSQAEQSPVGLGTPLSKLIGPTGTSAFCDRVLCGTMTQKDKESIPMQEALEMLEDIGKARLQVDALHDTESESTKYKKPVSINAPTN